MSHQNLKITDKVICIHGTCLDMCPPEEINLRKREKLVHLLEVTDVGHRLVKCYSRSAADSNMAVPRLLRPYPILLETTQYLLLEVSKRKDVKISVIYDFLNDRLRAVRQDMTIQRLPPNECVTLLEPMIRFYVYYGYRLCEYPIKEYDAVLNKKYLLECIKWFLTCSDALIKTNNIDSLIKKVTDCNINCNSMLSCDRCLVESLYILCNLHDTHPLYRYLTLPDCIKRMSALELAYKIAVENMSGNYVQVWRLAKRLCPLTFSALCLYLPTLQKRGLQIISSAYHSRQLSVPIVILQHWLGFTCKEEVRSACTYYGQKASDVVCFNKSVFKSDVEQVMNSGIFDEVNVHMIMYKGKISSQLPPRQHYLARISQMELEDVLCYTV